jgi:uncharacterized protein YggU (UPF0235/DUF167 family)
VTPSSSKTALVGWLGDVLKLRVMAPPEKGKANAAVEELLADVLNLQKAHVRVIAGKTQPRKVVEINGLAEADVRARLSKAIPNQMHS